MTLKATDGATNGKSLESFASVAIDVLDVQDQPPIFLNSPYSATVSENTEEGTSVMTIKAKDGDTGNPRQLLLSLEGDDLGYFRLETQDHNGEGVLVTSDTPLDRENKHVLQNGGIYTFFIKVNIHSTIHGINYSLMY